MKATSNNKWVTFLLPMIIIDIISYFLVRRTYGSVDFSAELFGEQHIFSALPIVSITAILHLLSFLILIVIVWLFNKDTTLIKTAVARSVILFAIMPICTLCIAFMGSGGEFMQQIHTLYTTARVAYFWAPIVSYVIVVWIFIKTNKKNKPIEQA